MIGRRCTTDLPEGTEEGAGGKKGREKNTHHKTITPCPLCTDIYPDSLNLLVILYTINDNMYSTSLQFYNEELFSKIAPLFVDAVLEGL